MFQFHIGSIKSASSARINAARVPCFNSTLVRLKVTIESENDDDFLSFNSTLVRLKDAIRSFAKR